MSQGETVRVPLFLKSFLRVPAWLVLGAVLLVPGALFLLLGLTARRGLGVVGAVLAMLGTAAICRAVSVLTVKVRLAPDHIARVTAFSRRRIAWSEVQLCSTGLLVAQRPHHGRLRVEGRDGTIRFRTRPEDYADVAARLRRHCRGAFLHDHVSGAISPPAGDRFAGELRERFRRIAARTSRRYLLVAAGQVLVLPLMLPLALVQLDLIVLPFGPADIAANFRRAAAARRSYRMHLEGQVAKP